MGGKGPAVASGPAAVRLVRGAAPAVPPPLRHAGHPADDGSASGGAAPVTGWDSAQAAVIGHRQGSGPLVVLGGPGTGKSAVLVGAILARVERDGVPPDGVLVLAPTRRAAAGLRDRISAVLARTVREPMARTPHSYAFGLLRRSLVMEGDVPPRLISGPEQDRVLADLLAGHEAGVGSRPRWPAGIGPEVRALRGFRDEVRDLLMRAVERGISPAGLAELGSRTGRADWVAAAEVFAEYLDVTSLATPGAFDPAGIVDAAARLLETDEDLLAEERRRWELVAVDDAQELTAAGMRLLRLLAGGGRNVIVTGDPDSATQAFRGARPRLAVEAADELAGADGVPARVVVLDTAHRHGRELRAVAARVAARIASPGTLAHRSARASGATPVDEPPPGPGPGPGTVRVDVLASAAQEAAFVAQHLRRRHLDDGVGWGRMAVVLRSARGTEVLRRALGAAGVPVTVAGAEVPLRDEPAVVPLRLAVRCALDPAALSPQVALDLLGGPIGGADALALRRLRQVLRAEELAGGGGRVSDVLLAEALRAPGHLASLDPRTSHAARRVAAVLAAGRAAAAERGATAESVLWAVWDATGLAGALQRDALAGGAAGARADRDLDAVVALFEAAARFTDRLPYAGPEAFLDDLEGQDLPADTLAERAPSGEAVALLTAQGAAGREWDVVAVAGVQEGQWPDLRLRTSLLGAATLAELADGRGTGTGSPAAQRRAVLDDELRLFHVAVSRARHDLLVTAVRSEDLLPSSFLDLVDVGGRAPAPAAGAGSGGGSGQAADPTSERDAEPVPEREPVPADLADAEGRALTPVPRTMTLPALVAELRAVVTDPAAVPGERAGAATQLARLAAAGVPGADPADWYGLAPLSAAGALRPPPTSVRVSPSRVEAFGRCPLRWLLEQCGGTRPSSAAQGLGTLLHEIAEEVPDGDPGRTGALLDERFPRLGLGDGWLADVERARAERMLAKFAEYVRLARREGRDLLAVERDVEVTVGRAVVRGQVDRLERDAEGRPVVVDLKTGRSQPTAAELPRHAQLGVYQAAVEAGGVDDLTGGRPSGGGILVQLGSQTKSVRAQEQPALSADEDPHWAETMVREVAEGMAGDSFPATVNPFCRMCDLRRCCPARSEGRQVGQ